MTKKVKVFLVGGGTGGHFFPAVALGERLLERDYKVFMITDRRCARYIKEDFPFASKIIAAGTFKRGLVQKIRAVIDISLGVVQSISLLLSKRPKVVIGFGGYPVLPMLFAAKLLRIPIVLHEQNCFMGRTNSFFLSTAKVIATSFEATQNLPQEYSSKVVVTGNPVRKQLYELEPQRDFSTTPFKLFVVGGSQGAFLFSKLLPNAMKILRENNKDLDIEITQQASKEDCVRLRKVYKKLGIKCEVKPFFHDMDKQLVSHQLFISRAGASTIAELISAGQPAILIPFPFAANQHQLHNAEYLVVNRAGWLFKQETLSPELLANKIEELISKPTLLKKVSNNLLKMKKDSAYILADTVEKIIAAK